MAGAGVLVGARVGPFDGRLDAEFVRGYAAATNDPSPLVRAGGVVPPVAVVTQIFHAQIAGRTAAIPEDFQLSAEGGVHGEHDVVLHRPIEPGEPLRVWVEGHGARPVKRNALVALRYTAYDRDDQLVAEQWWTTLYLGTTCDEVGEQPPDHTFPDDAWQRPVGSFTVPVDEAMPRRYAEVSGDWAEHHFDIEAARRTGFDRLFLHGVCTMGLCTQGIVDMVADGDPARVRRVAVRFASPTWLGEEVRVRVYDAGKLGYAFEAECAGANVITHGRVELH